MVEKNKVVIDASSEEGTSSVSKALTPSLGAAAQALKKNTPKN